MEIYISIDGVLRNFIQKFDYHYQDCFIDSDPEEKAENFQYGIKYPIHNDDLMDYYLFHSKTEFENFCFIEYPLEIFGHAGLSYSTSISDLNKLIYENKNINFTIVGLDELGRAKPSTLFFLSKNQFLGNNIKFIRSDDIDKEWKKCDIWITDNRTIIKKCPTNKQAIKFITDYNQYFYHNLEINNLTKINELCLKSWEKNITLILTKLLKNAVSLITVKKPKQK